MHVVCIVNYYSRHCVVVYSPGTIAPKGISAFREWREIRSKLNWTQRGQAAAVQL